MTTIRSPLAVSSLLALVVWTVPPVSAQAWQAWPSPEAAGFDRTLLTRARHHADSARSGAVFVAYSGHVLAAWGDVTRPFKAHSVRKSLLSGLYGALVGEGAVDLDATLADLGIDDATPLTEAEQQARVQDLLAARSGVFLPAAYAPSEQDELRPPRGSHAPGTHWFYNNWDFNVAGVIAERATGETVYAAFDRRIAQPVGMEDYDAASGFSVYEPSASRHPAHTFRISARDLARFGQLYLQRGRWGGTHVVPAAWVAESMQPVTDFGDGEGYGFMWWTYAAGSLGPTYPHLNRYDMYMGRGTGGQALFVIPDAELVIVHRGDTDNNRPVRGADVWRIADLILAARTGEPAPDPALRPVEAIPFESQRPAPASVSVVALPPAEWEDYLGAYEIAEGVVARVYPWQGRLFGLFPGQGEGELFALGDDRFTVRVVAGVEIRFERGADGEVVAMNVRMGPDRFRGVKR